MLFPDFEESDEHSSSMVVSVSRYNNLYSGNRSVLLKKTWSWLREFPLLFRRFLRFASNPRNLAATCKLLQLLLIAIAYLLSPFDILSEAALGLIGFIDDFFIVLIILIYISHSYYVIMQGRSQDRVVAAAET